MMDGLRELYQEVILDHGKNPLCGDQLVVYLKLNLGEVIEDVSFVGKGCAISVASASMMTELVRGKTVDEANDIFDHVHHMCTGEGEPSTANLGPDADRLGVLHTLKAAIEGGEDATSEA